MCPFEGDLRKQSVINQKEIQTKNNNKQFITGEFTELSVIRVCEPKGSFRIDDAGAGGSRSAVRFPASAHVPRLVGALRSSLCSMWPLSTFTKISATDWLPAAPSIAKVRKRGRGMRVGSGLGSQWGDGGFVFRGDRVSVWDDKKDLGTNGEDVCSAP